MVNFAHTEGYRNSAVPFCQRLLNADAKDREAAAKVGSVEGQAGTGAGTGELARRREEAG